MSGRSTPGVYITEFSAFPPSVVGVATAVPVFIGYTETATSCGKSVAYTPVLVTSLADYETIFGGAPPPKCTIAATPAGATPDIVAPVWDGNALAAKPFSLTVPPSFLLYASLRLFFVNGGGSCYVVSTGGYDKTVSLEALKKGLDAAGTQMGVTLTVVPDAMRLPSSSEKNGIPTSSDYATLTRAMIDQAAAGEDRMAIVDVYGSWAIDTTTPVTTEAGTTACADAFYGQIEALGLSYGAAYFPFLETTVMRPGDVDYRCFDTDSDSFTLLGDILAGSALAQYPGPNGTPQGNDDPHFVAAMTLIGQMATTPASGAAALDQNLRNAVGVLRDLENIVLRRLNVLPPSGAMAGIFALNDQTRGVWNAPANLTPNMVLQPTVRVTDTMQGALNVPVNGKAIDVIRDFPGRGTVVWGARTLDGNSNDYRYIQVRRTIMYIEQSIKQALAPFTFAPNDGKTWTTVTQMVSSFLQSLWSQGGLMGAKASDAFTVQCGLGSTMTAQDILDGNMIVAVTLQMIRPAEFIELTFAQKMQGA